MSSVNTRIERLLPVTFKHDVQSCVFSDDTGEQFHATITTECPSAEMCDKWLSDFSSSSLCTWRVRKTYPNPLRGIVYRKDYACHHSSFNKHHPKRQLTKDTACSARLSIKVCWCLLCYQVWIRKTSLLHICLLA